VHDRGRIRRLEHAAFVLALSRGLPGLLGDMQRFLQIATTSGGHGLTGPRRESPAFPASPAFIGRDWYVKHRHKIWIPKNKRPVARTGRSWVDSTSEPKTSL
jgi:hypothetical protein